jgi:TonB family protein
MVYEGTMQTTGLLPRVLACCALATLASPLRAGDPGDDAIGLQLERAEVVVVEVTRHRMEPPRFRSASPSAVVSTRRLLREQIDGEPARALARWIGDHLHTRPAPACSLQCPADSLEWDVVSMRIGDRKRGVAVKLRFDEGWGAVMQPAGSTESQVVCLGHEGEALLALLRGSLPGRQPLAALVACDPVRAATGEALRRSVNPFALDSLPDVVAQVAPQSPDAARREGRWGTVMVQALVSVNGVVVSTRVVESIPSLDEAAVRAVERWRFRPAYAGGAPIATWVAVPVRFSLSTSIERPGPIRRSRDGR